MIPHLFHLINQVFCPNEESDTERKNPISRKKLGQGDGAWSTQKTVLGCNLDTVSHLPRLPLQATSQARGIIGGHPQYIPHHVTAQVAQAPGASAKHHPGCSII